MMTRFWPLGGPALLLLALGCGRSAAPEPQPGDVTHPEIAFAPEGVWSAGERISVGVLLRVGRPGGESFHLTDGQVADGGIVTGRLIYLSGGKPVGDPLALPFERDC